MSPSLRWTRCIVSSGVLLYGNLVLTNLVSMRQRWYVEKKLNGTEMQPLHDTFFFDWFDGQRVPLPVEMTLRDMVDVCTYVWVLLTFIAWGLMGQKPVVIAKILMAQVILIPIFSVAQLLTIVPDATPNCLTLYDIPSGAETNWLFYRWPSRTCGNMLWSSDTAQLVIWANAAVELISNKKKRCRCIIYLVGEAWLIMTMGFIFSSRYQYSVDVISTILVVRLLVTHPMLTKMARYCFVRRAEYFERVPVQEIPPYSGISAA